MLPKINTERSATIYKNKYLISVFFLSLSYYKHNFVNRFVSYYAFFKIMAASKPNSKMSKQKNVFSPLKKNLKTLI